MSKDFFHQIIISDDSSKVVVPDATKSVHENFKDVDYKLWLNEDLESFIKSEFHERVYLSYKALNPYAYKADLARYCLLYKFGGWYSDINNTFVSTPPDTRRIDLLYFMDIPENSTKDSVSNGVLYAKPNNEVYDLAIRNIVLNCFNKYYGPNSLSPTGPALLGKVMKSGVRKNKSWIGNLVDDKSSEKKARFVLDEEIFCFNKSNKHLPGGNAGIAGGNNYNDLWKSRKVYDLDVWRKMINDT
jgi:mannosyltransferase OCH1-like enzyme